MTARPVGRRPAPTIAHIRATLITAASIVESVGLCQGQAQDLTGAVCPTRAIAIAADEDVDVALFAVFEVERLLGAGGPHSDLVAWADRPHVTKDDVARLLRNAARYLDHDFTTGRGREAGAA